MASAHHPHSLKSDPTPAARHRPAPTPHRPPCTPWGRPVPHGLGWRRIPQSPQPALTATALGYWERKGRDTLPLPGRLLKPRPSQRDTARAEGQKASGRTRSGAALRWLVLCPAGTADLGGGCRYVVDRRDAVAPRSVLAERAPALRSRPASWFPIHSPAALSPLCAPGAACNAASWPQE